MERITRYPIILWMTICLWLLAGCDPEQLVIQPADLTCIGPFEATVHQGPNTGLSLIGDLELTIDGRGDAIGVLRLEEEDEVSTVGQVDGKAINLVFVVGEERYIYGVGGSVQDIRDCDAVWGGPFVGPDSGDMGDWARKRPGRH